MRQTRPRWAVAAATLAILGAGLAAGHAEAGITPQPTADNTASNPVLAQNANGWGTLSGGTGSRVAVSGHPVASYAYDVTLSGSAAGIYLPQQAVTAGTAYTFAVDAKSSGQVKIQVDWYGAGDAYLGSTEGSAVATTASAWTKVSAQFTAPAGAVNTHPLASVTSGSGHWQTTAADYRTSGGTPPPTGGSSAAEKFGWGTPLPASDEFNYTGAPDSTKWNAAGECWAGHAGNGRRCASRSTVANGYLRQTGLANGDSAWLASKLNKQYGRWEARIRSNPQGANNGRQYHPLLIVWPESDRWPQDGEYDFLENGAPGQACAESFMHYPHNAGIETQQIFGKETNCGAALTEWHNVALEWTPNYVKGFIDGVQWFSYTGGANSVRRCIQCMPSGHLTIQLDNFYGANMQPASYDVDWARIYNL
ncbi:family 16 glycosylhydrolase [Kribbella sp. NPDC056861]|uniref:family 16 glycosylhydrolase n=1 Tax=Kribbella sp. NPDC056861 TaxID=3154857 RepID=UPI0034422D4C